jgi:TolA-binding protein
MRMVFSLVAVLVCVAIVSTLAKKQVTTTIVVPTTSSAEPKSVKTIDLPKQVQQELNKAAEDATKRIDQADSK